MIPNSTWKEILKQIYKDIIMKYRSFLMGLLFCLMTACSDDIDTNGENNYPSYEIVSKDSLSVEELYVIQTNKEQILSSFIIYDKKTGVFKFDLSDTDTIGLGFSKSDIDWAKECTKKMNETYKIKNIK